MSVSGNASGSLPSRDLVDVRLAAAIERGGCALCAVRARSETATLDAIIAERVLDIGFREGLERTHGFCRRHAVALLAADRRGSGIVGSSILFGAIVERRVGALRAAFGARGRSRRGALADARRRPPCPACEQGASAVDIAAARLVERASDPAWAAVIGDIPFCLDDLGELLAVAAATRQSAAFEVIAERQLARLDELARRLDGYAHHSAHDRRHLLTDSERSAAAEAAHVLGGDDD